MRVISLIAGMYAITFTLFLFETGSIWKASTLGLLSASLKSAFSWGHCMVWEKLKELENNKCCG